MSLPTFDPSVHQTFFLTHDFIISAQMLDDVLGTKSSDWQITGARHDSIAILECKGVTMQPARGGGTQVFNRGEPIDLEKLKRW